MTDFSLPTILDGEDKDSPLKNRVRKNYKHLRKWAIRSQTNCFRIYDRDIKEYPLAIDFYAGRFLVQYFPIDKEGDEAKQTYLQKTAEEALCSLFGVEASAIYFRSRIKRTKTQQYEKISSKQEFFTVLEHGVKFRVNLSDYLDTGLFLDHRATRQVVASQAKGKSVLNLFAYTCSFSVHAALAGASYTKSVDLSNTYTEWGEKNFQLNEIPLRNHVIVREDCLKFLQKEVEFRHSYDVIVVDPPTLSRSKKMEDFFDIQQDYIALLSSCLKILAPGGTIFFSTNSRKFSLDSNSLPPCTLKDISSKTLPLDFRDAKIHRCWEIQHAELSR